VGDGAIARNGRVITVTVRWDESRMSQSRLVGAANTESFVFVTEF
jgi:type IV pilus assembly protein PilV